MMTFIKAAYQILKKEDKPLSSKQITEMAIAKGLITTSGKTPWLSMSARIWEDMRKNGDKSRFRKLESGKYYLRQFNQKGRS